MSVKSLCDSFRLLLLLLIGVSDLANSASWLSAAISVAFCKLSADIEIALPRPVVNRLVVVIVVLSFPAVLDAALAHAPASG